MNKRVALLTLFVVLISVGMVTMMVGNAAAAGKTGMALQSGTDLLLIPDRLNTRVMGFDPTTGSLVDPNVIPPDAAHLENPVHAMLSADGTKILVSDSSLNVVQKYDLNGTYLGYFAPKGGPDTSILQSPFGMALRPNGNLLVTVQAGVNADAVAEFDTEGNYQGNFIENGAGGLELPFSILYRASHSDYLVAGTQSDTIYRFDLNGSLLGILTSDIIMPIQVSEAADGHLWVSNLSGGWVKIVELSSSGSLIDSFTPMPIAGGYGVYPLPNGNVLATLTGEVREVDGSGTTVDIEASGVNGGLIQFVEAPSRNGFWAADGETGTAAMVIIIEDDLMAFAWGAFDADTGAPTWIFARAPKIGTNSYSGPLLEFAGGPSFTSGPKALTKIDPIGTIIVTFTSYTTGTISGNIKGVIFNKTISKSPFE